MTIDEAIKDIKDNIKPAVGGKSLDMAIEALERQRWIPIKWHDCTDEDREKYGFNNDIVVVFDCEMPDDNQSILVTTSHGYINQDVCYIDDGYSLDSGWDWIDDIKAWMPLPEPYQEGCEQDG